VHLDSEFSLHRSKISKDLSAMQMNAVSSVPLLATAAVLVLVFNLVCSEGSAAVYRELFFGVGRRGLSSQVSRDSDGMSTRSDRAKAPLG
jgi:hypothetical protein